MDTRVLNAGGPVRGRIDTMVCKQCVNCEGYVDIRYEPDVCLNCITGETTVINLKGETVGSIPYVPKGGMI